jgi:hypothetical protein
MIEQNGLYWLILKDETKTPVRKQLRVASPEQPGGPFSAAGAPITGSWVEGPSAVQVGDWIHIDYDHYTDPQHYGGLRTPDFLTYADITAQLKFPVGARHGTVIRLTDPPLVNRLLPAPVR